MTLNNYKRAYEKLALLMEYLAVHDDVNYKGVPVPEHLKEIKELHDGRNLREVAEQFHKEAREMVL